jgi:ABC-type dipeptide/oligopeptide/nickel transport system ATPase subunit
LIISHDRYLVRELADCLYILRSSSRLDQIAAADVDNSADIRRILAASHGNSLD